MPRFAIASTKVCLPEGLRPAVVIVAGEKIESVVAMEDFGGDVPCEHLGDLMISPGVIDTHVHVNEPGRTEWEGFATATNAAAAGGVTTIIDMPLNSSPVTTSLNALAEKRQAAQNKCRVDVGFYGGVVPENVESFHELLVGGVFGIKAFLCDSGLDEFPRTGESELRVVLPFLRDTGVPLLVHAELVDASDVGTVTDQRSYRQYLSSRPDQWETNAIELLIELCREFQAPIHVVHVSTQAAARKITEANTQGLPISFETCPHYLYFNSEQVIDGDTRFKCAPPIRSTENGKNLWSMLTKGLIKTVGSDHSPCPPGMKLMEAGDFVHAWGGISGLQFTLPVMATLARSNKLPMESIAEWLSANPAQLIGLQDRKGKIKVGLDADLVVWEPDTAFVVETNDIFHRHKVTPYEGESLFGKVQRTYVRGNLVFQNGNLCGPPLGQLLERTA